ncbi:unnamed protein product [Urochloa decumbens]|uniref:Uncharacterized protein n=1 Tax=Urochloa decumbens TaxID=240449 RepID=A0ABC8ZMR2_9POAL
MEGSIASRVCSGVRSCWMRRRSSYHYQRLPASAGRGVRLGRRAVVLASTPAWRFGRQLRRRAGAVARWPSPLRLLHRIVDAYVNSLLSQPLNILRAAEAPVVAPSSPPTKPRGEASPGSARRRGGDGGRGVMLNICVAEALLLRRSTSEVRRSPLQQPRKAARCTSVRG